MLSKKIIKHPLVLFFILLNTNIMLFAQENCNFQIEAGEDISLDVGQAHELHGQVSVIPLSINWSPEMGLSCTDCYMPTVTGVENICYVFSATDSTECTLMDTICVLIDPTNSNQIEHQNSINLFPNPASDHVSLYSEFLIMNNVEIYNATGKLLFNEEIFNSKKKIEVSNLPKGIYYIKVRSNELYIIEKIFIK